MRSLLRQIPITGSLMSTGCCWTMYPMLASRGVGEPGVRWVLEPWRSIASGMWLREERGGRGVYGVRCGFQGAREGKDLEESDSEPELGLEPEAEGLEMRLPDCERGEEF